MFKDNDIVVLKDKTIHEFKDVKHKELDCVKYKPKLNEVVFVEGKNSITISKIKNIFIEEVLLGNDYRYNINDIKPIVLLQKGINEI